MARLGIRDVAAVAEVAVGTVSNYLNHPQRVAPEKAERIRSAIETLGFVRNNAGRQLRLGESSAIAYIAPDVSNPFFAEIAEGVERRAAERGLSVFFANSHRDRERENGYLDLFEQHQVRGMLVSSHEAIEDRLARVRARGTPSVLVGQAAAAADQPSISIDDVLGGRLAAEHLLETGRRKVCFVGGPLGVKQVGDRLAGASEAVSAVPGATLEVIDATDRTLRGGRDAGHRIAARPGPMRPDAIFAANDLLALGILQTLVFAGVAVPDEVAIVGYDDIEFGEASIIPLTSVRTPHEGFGFAAVDLLFDAIASGAAVAEHRVFAPELVVRASSATGGARTDRNDGGPGHPTGASQFMTRGS